MANHPIAAGKNDLIWRQNPKQFYRLLRKRNEGRIPIHTGLVRDPRDLREMLYDLSIADKKLILSPIEIEIDNDWPGCVLRCSTGDEGMILSSDIGMIFFDGTEINKLWVKE